MEAWYASRFTGLFTRFGPIPPRVHDPALAVCSGTLPPWGLLPEGVPAGGVGWDAAAAEAACVGEAIERLQPYPLPGDGCVEASYRDWPLDEPAVPPRSWVLFHAEQYAQPGFPFEPFTEHSVCRWVCFRRVPDGVAWWVPAELAYLFLRTGERHRFAPSVSTGLSCGRVGDPVLLRGLQEVIERDAVVGAWWGQYPLEEWTAETVLRSFGDEKVERLTRPNLRYRFYRVATPFSAHVTLVTLEGEDREGSCFSAGSACRETRRESWLKATTEVVHGRHYVRYLLGQSSDTSEVPTDFPQHAVHYSKHPERLGNTVLHRAATGESVDEGVESVPHLVAQLGEGRPVLFRNMTAPGIAQAVPEWYVLKVVVPGLQPLHGNHLLPFLGGTLWSPRGWRDWATMPPHPFP